MAPAVQLNVWTAASDGDLDRVKHLVEDQGFAPDVRDENGYTPVHAAVSWGHPELLRYLTSKGGRINVTDQDGDTPLFVAETVDMLKLVIELGGDPKIRNKSGQTAAQFFHSEDNTELSQYLASVTGESLGDSRESVADDDTDAETLQHREDLDSLDPASRQAALETNERAGALLERVQAILIDADSKGEDPEERIRAVVDEAVRNTMEAGRRLATTQLAEVETPASAPNSSESDVKRARTD